MVLLNPNNRSQLRVDAVLAAFLLLYNALIIRVYSQETLIPKRRAMPASKWLRRDRDMSSLFSVPAFFRCRICTILRRTASSGMLRRVALVRTDVSEELSASFIRVTRISELGTTLAATSNRRTQRALL
jgi:hypothetical protein